MFRGDFEIPTQVIFGAGRLAELPQRVAGWGEQALIVTSAGVRRGGAADPVLQALAASDLDYRVFDDLDSNPTVDNVEAGVRRFQDGCDFLIALGGGSALDAAKAIRLRVGCPHALGAFDECLASSPAAATLPPLVAIPTTAGTGSEVSPVATITVGGRKTILRGAGLVPTLALCDPELTLDLPARLTAGSGATVIAQCVEACLSTDFDPLAEAAARAGLERAAAHLAPAVRDGHNVESRAQLMAASLLSGVAVRRGQGAGQSLSCALASVAGVYHGIANAVLLPHVVRYNREHVSGDAIRGVALSLGVAPAESAPETADRVAEALAALFAEAGLPSQLHQANVNHALLPTVAGLAMQDAGHRRSPRPLTQADAEAILTEAL